MEWQPIETAPTDGTVIDLRREYSGFVFEGRGLFGVVSMDAPQRFGLGIDPLGRMKPADYAREDRERGERAGRAKWISADHMYDFPVPTHWKPA